VAGFLDKILAERFFTPAELEYAQNGSKSEHLAACFAAREAASKALGLSLSEIGRQDVELLHLESGRPILKLYGRALARAQEQGINAWHISVSHDQDKAVVFVIAESRCDDE
jgi:holo-[acyl-carrier protein] synthase